MIKTSWKENKLDAPGKRFRLSDELEKKFMCVALIEIGNNGRSDFKIEVEVGLSGFIVATCYSNSTFLRPRWRWKLYLFNFIESTLHKGFANIHKFFFHSSTHC